MFEIDYLYEKQLIENGWIYKNQDSMTFIKEDISVYFERRYAKDTDWNFSISICWENNR